MERIGLFAVVVLQLMFAPTALAYRPFDSTDADVAHAGEFELELAPVGWLREGPNKFLVAPAVVGNIGLSGDRELVLQGQHELALDREGDEPHSAVVDNGAFVKHVLRRGTLQGENGPSAATEYGFLLPSVHGEHGTGVSLAGIVSQRWESATIHFNAALARTREHEPDVFLGTILEGPHDWALRPVGEVFTERTTGSARIDSYLVGAIWRAREGISFDVGVRYARAGTDPIRELRLGLTWAFPYRTEP